MDLENKPNMKRTRIGGGKADVYVDSDWWWIGGCICGLGLVVDRRMYMWTRVGGGQADVYGSGMEYVGGGCIWLER